VIETITVDALAGTYRDPGVTVVDARPTAAYNGWRLNGEARGGHIPGAVAFPQAWAAGRFDHDLSAHLASKGITPDRKIVVYGYGGGGGTALADRLVALGFHEVSILAGGQPEWGARNGTELTRLPNYRHLVPASWLQQLLDGDDVEEAPAGDYAVFHVGYGVPADYERGHIPGAFFLDTNALESNTDWNRRSPKELEAALAALGIAHDTTVIVYGRDSAADPAEQKPGMRAGQIAATRVTAILLYSGVGDVRLLDGGCNAWVAAGYPLDTEPHVPTAQPDFGRAIPAHPEYFIDYEEATDLITDPGGVLVSIRSRDEREGKTSGYNYIDAVGDIPGAVWGNGGTDAYHMQEYRNIDNTMRSFHEVAANWEAEGITPDKKVAFYCGTGWRASETLFHAHLMGWPNAAVYDGGWFEWSRRAASPTSEV
jgi:thiosulfate/3-mercaptopyruvate sulfurtransferase